MNGQMPMQIGPDLLLLLPELAVFAAGALALAAEIVRRPVWSLCITVLGLLAGAVLALPLLGRDTPVFQGTYRVDALSTWAGLILFPSTALVAVLAAADVRGSDREGTVYALLVFTTLGASVLAGAGDMLFLVLGVLLSSLGAFALVAYARDDRATEAAMKYFVFGSVSEAAMIFGLTFWFGATGSTALDDLSRLGHARLAAGAGLIAVLVGLGYKAALVPFHFWAPDAYDGGHVSIAAYLSVVPKVGAIFALAQVVRTVPETALDWRLLLALVAAASMTYGNLAALVQTNVIRLLAYSSFAQSGYFLLGVVAMGRTGLAAQALVIFAAAYAAMNLGAFAMVARVGRDIDTFTGFGRSSPWGGAALVVFLLSLVGVPPLAGFFGKLLLFGAVIDGGYGWLAAIAIGNSVLSLAVYLRLIVPTYRLPGGVVSRSPASAAVATVSLMLTVALGLGVQILLARVA